jgi:hypothetical protein
MALRQPPHRLTEIPTMQSARARSSTRRPATWSSCHNQPQWTSDGALFHWRPDDRQYLSGLSRRQTGAITGVGISGITLPARPSVSPAELAVITHEDERYSVYVEHDRR